MKGPVDVNSVAFSPDGHYIASGSCDDTIHLWDVSSGREVSKLKGHASEFDSVVFSPDGRYIAAGTEDGIICIWDVSEIADKKYMDISGIEEEDITKGQKDSPSTIKNDKINMDEILQELYNPPLPKVMANYLLKEGERLNRESSRFFKSESKKLKERADNLASYLEIDLEERDDQENLPVCRIGVKGDVLIIHYKIKLGHKGYALRVVRMDQTTSKILEIAEINASITVPPATKKMWFPILMLFLVNFQYYHYDLSGARSKLRKLMDENKRKKEGSQSVLIPHLYESSLPLDFSKSQSGYEQDNIKAIMFYPDEERGFRFCATLSPGFNTDEFEFFLLNLITA